MAKALPEFDLSRFADKLANKPAQTLDEIKWVANHLHCDLDKIGEDDPPSMWAVVLLTWANANIDKFVDVWKATIPTKSQIEKQQELRDDGRVLRLLDNMEREFAAAHRAA